MAKPRGNPFLDKKPPTPIPTPKTGGWAPRPAK